MTLKPTPKSANPKTTDPLELQMPFIPHTEADVQTMLAEIGAPDLEALFDEIPDHLRNGALNDVPEGMSEMDML